jgi:4-diphosphocytidyl-2-C-methyl-D-erythritol kinase
MLTVLSPAKINLTLEVLGQRPDGFHEIRSMLQAISLCDSLHFQAGQGMTFRCDMSGWSAGESLVSRTASLLQETTGYSGGATIEIEKRIPIMSGLGGDSSDAAATLRGLNKLWKLDLPAEKLLELAARLGSDVTFFLYGGTALAGGRGERIAPLPPLANMWVVLVVPDIPRLPGKTKQMYASLHQNHYTDGKITENFIKALKEGEFEVSRLFNTFENVAFDAASKLNVSKEHFTKLGAPHVHLAGSGPTLFTMLKDKSQAGDLYLRCQQQGMEVYLAETVGKL